MVPVFNLLKIKGRLLCVRKKGCADYIKLYSKHC